MSEYKNDVIKYLNTYFPTVITNLITEYGYYLEGKTLLTLREHYNAVTSVDVLPDQRIVSSSKDGTLKIWNPHNYQKQCEITECSNKSGISYCTVLINGKIISSSHGFLIKIWKVQDDKCICENILSSIFSHRFVTVFPNGNIITANARYISLWNVSDNDNNYDYVLIPNKQNEPVNCMAYLQNGQVVTASFYRRKLRVWKLNEEKNDTIRLIGHSAGITCVISSLDGSMIVSGSFDKTLKIWNPNNIDKKSRSIKCDLTLIGHVDAVKCVKFLPDGRIISGSDDCTLKVWNPMTGECSNTFVGHNNSVSCVTIMSDGKIVSGSDDDTIKIWY